VLDGDAGAEHRREGLTVVQCAAEPQRQRESAEDATAARGAPICRTGGAQLRNDFETKGTR
jgi:hypothetical protein